MRASASQSVSHRLILAASYLGTQVIVLGVLLGPLLQHGWWRGFRNYFPNDQLSYAAIAITASNGTLTPVEPLTETGTSHYPSAWYLLLGMASAIFDQPVYRIWTILGLSAIGAGLAFLGWLTYRTSRLAIAPLLPGLFIVTGTLSMITANWWYASLTNHAVIWGPFGTFFTLNAEAVGLTLASVALGLVIIVMTSPEPRTITLLSAALILGALANVQTYAFLTGTSLAVILTAVFTLLRFPSRQRLIATAVLLALVIASGPFLAEIIGPLPLFILILAAALPAAWPLLRLRPGITLLTLSVFVVAAAPQVLRTALGIATGDDFLTYRQQSTDDLGVQPLAAVTAALPLILIAAFSVVILIRSPHSPERTAFSALLIALGIGAVLMAANDRWGFEQEPYRFWLQYSIITALLLAVVTAWSIRQWRALDQRWRIGTAAIGSIAIVTWVVSLADVRSFWSNVHQQGVIAVEDDRGRALQQLVSADEGLVLSSQCLDPQVLKLITGAPVVAFNRGLAWPDNRTEIDLMLGPERVGGSDPKVLARLGITAVVTDSTCEGDWNYADARVQPTAVAAYPDGLFTLWRVQP